MRMIALLGLMFCMSAYAEDGLVIHFTISKLAAEKKSTYANGVLMRMNEATTFNFPDLYELRIESRKEGAENVNLQLTLKDLMAGKPRYAGSGATTMEVGTSRAITLDAIESSPARYEVFLDTAYGELPARSQATDKN